jgi:hypothetical protein
MRTLIIAGSVIALLAATAQAQLYTVTEISRWVEYDVWEEDPYSGETTHYTDRISSSETGLFDEEVLYEGWMMATQTSDLLPQSIVATGQARSGGHSSAKTRFAVTFELHEYCDAVIEALAYADSSLGTSGNFSVNFKRLDGELNLDGFSRYDGIDLYGVLEPGTYSLGTYIDATSTSMPNQGDMSIDLQLTPIPEPHSLLLLAIGGCLLGRRQRNTA